MPLQKDYVASLNPLINFYIYASDFGALIHLRSRLINMNSTIFVVMLKENLRQGGSLVMKFG